MHTTFIPTLPLRVSSRPHSSLSRRSAKAHFFPTPVMSLSPADPSDKILQGPIEGQYSPWYFRQSDANGVQLYRVSLAVMALTSATCFFLSTFYPSTTPPAVYDSLYFLTLSAFGVALQKIHIYMRPMHDALKVLCVGGMIGSVVIAGMIGGDGLVVGLYEKPQLLLATGWWFVALAGLFVKEALCFGRLEAAALIVLLPVLMGGHFLGALSGQAEQIVAGAFVSGFAFFAVRKLLQNKVDDVGDLSVFEYLDKGGQL